MPRYPGIITRMRRTVPWQRNPLMPGDLRLWFVMRPLIWLWLAATVSVSVMLGSMVYHDECRAESTSGVHVVKATLDADASVHRGPGSSEALGHWDYAGVRHSAVLAVAPTAHDGDTVAIAVDAAGNPSALQIDPLSSALGAGLVLLAGALGTTVLWWRVGQYMCDRRRAAAWEAEWRRLTDKPDWNRR